MENSDRRIILPRQIIDDLGSKGLSSAAKTLKGLVEFLSGAGALM